MAKKETKQTKETKPKVKLEEELAEAQQRLVQISEGYQNLLQVNQSLNVLVMKYEETINILTARLIEARQTQG